jgi:hypothetical protein
MRAVLSYLWARLVGFFVPRQILLMRENSSRWKKLRAAHLEKEPTCAVCGRAAKLEVHHIIPVAFDESKQFEPGNLITLCAFPCHIMFGHFFCYHCYNKDVRTMAAEFKKAMKKRRCLATFRKR